MKQETRGRKKLPAHKRKDKKLCIRFSPVELLRLEEMAYDNKQTVTELVRQKIFGQVIKG